MILFSVVECSAGRRAGTFPMCVVFLLRIALLWVVLREKLVLATQHNTKWHAEWDGCSKSTRPGKPPAGFRCGRSCIPTVTCTGYHTKLSYQAEQLTPDHNRSKFGESQEAKLAFGPPKG